MVQQGALCCAICAIGVFLSACCDAQSHGIGTGVGQVVKAKAADLPERCKVTYREQGKTRVIIDNGVDIIEADGEDCKLDDGIAGDATLVCFLYSTLLIMPLLYFMSVHGDTSGYTWLFLDSFMGIFIAILWWSCFQDRFDELAFPQRLFIFVVVRCVLVPAALYALSDHEHLFGIASILKHVCAFIAVSAGTEALKFAGEAQTPCIDLLGLCAVVVVLNSGMWKLKSIFAEMYLKGAKCTVRRRKRWEEVTTELGLDVIALCLAAMLFLSVNLIFFKDSELLREGADLSMGNTRLFDSEAEGKFAAVYSLVMFTITMVLEHLGGVQHSHSRGKKLSVNELREGQVAKLRRQGTVNNREVVLWDSVVFIGNSKVELISPSVFETPVLGQKSRAGEAPALFKKSRAGDEILIDPRSELKEDAEDEWRDYLVHVLQLGLMASASWSGLLAICFFVRHQWFPFLMERHLEGSLFVSVVLMILSGFVVAVLSAHGKDKVFDGKIMKYFRVYFLRSVSLMAALSWDMTFDAAVEDLPMHALVSEEHEFAGKILVATFVTLLVAPIYVLGMQPSIAAAIALVEHREMEELEGKDD